jgi:hypothetical protein
VEPSFVEQANAGTVAVCIGSGANGADGKNESVAGTHDFGAREINEFASCACDAGGVSSEDE